MSEMQAPGPAKVSSDQLVYKIGLLTMELDYVREQLGQAVNLLREHECPPCTSTCCTPEEGTTDDVQP